MVDNKALTFNELFEKNFEQLDLYTAAITRAHGKSHPETFEVRELFNTIQSKMNEADTNTPNLNAEFASLRLTTNNYMIPEDVCATYMNVYNMLAELDKAYLNI